MSDLRQMLDAHDYAIWSDEDDGGDIVAETVGALRGLSSEFRSLAMRLDAQGEASAATASGSAQSAKALADQLALLNKSVATLLSSQTATLQAVLALEKILSAPKRIIKDKDGKPVGVEVMA